MIVMTCVRHHEKNEKKPRHPRQEGTKKTMTDLLARYPTLTSNVVLSDYPTAELGQRLQAFVITNKNKQVNGVVGKGKMLVVAAIHAREIATAETSE